MEAIIIFSDVRSGLTGWRQVMGGEGWPLQRELHKLTESEKLYLRTMDSK